MPDTQERPPTGPPGTTVTTPIPPGADIAGALVAAARRLRCTVTKEGPPGTVRVTWNGQSVLVPARDSTRPGPRASAVSRLASLLSAAALAALDPPLEHEERERNTATQLLLHRLLPDANTAPAPAGGRAAAAADTIAAHCEKVLAPLPPPRHPAVRPGSPKPRRPQVADPPVFSTRPAGRPRSSASSDATADEEESPGDGSPEGALFARPADRQVGQELLTRIWKVNEAAAAWYREQLTPRSWGYRYMTRERGFSREVLDEFEIGFAPPGADRLTGHLRSLVGDDGTRLYPDDLIVAAGLAVRADGELTDRLRNRVIFPIRNHNGDLAGFGGRKHPRSRNKANPKYLNTPETAAYSKGAILYGLHQSRQALAEGAAPVILEGYTDVMAAWCVSGGTYAPVAPLGTALTADQATALGAHGRLHDGVPVLLAGDPDEAGRKAVLRDIRIVAPRHTRDARFVKLEEDPADTWLHRGGPALRAALDAHVPAEDVLTDTVLAGYADRLPGGKYASAWDYGPVLACHDVARALARAVGGADRLAVALGSAGIRRQTARVALATGEPFSSVQWRFTAEWFPDRESWADEAEQAFDEMPREEWIGKWAPLMPSQSIERYLAEGPPAEPGPEELKEIAARADEQRGWHGPACLPGPRTPGRPSATRGSSAKDRDPPVTRLRASQRRRTPSSTAGGRAAKAGH